MRFSTGWASGECVPRFPERLLTVHRVMSLVVSLNRAQDRARLVTHLCDIAQSLRVLNNYSSLRAFHVGINCVCETGDVVQSQVPDKVWRKYQSADKLLRVNENHLLYRLAVKNTFGAGIPSL
jgi:hypothetical protein